MYRTILTKVGRSKIGNFVLTQQPVLLKHFAVGDSGGTAYSPTEDQTELKNEKYRVEISKAEIIQQGDINKVSVEALLASNVGGFLINEVGLFDEAGDLIAVARQPERFKPLVEDGTTSEMKFIIEFYIANASSVQIKVDPSIIVITQEDLNKHNDSNKSHEDIRSSIRSHVNNQENPHGVTLEQIGAAELQHEHEYSTIKNKPETFPPSSHKHNKSEIIDFTHNHDDIYYTEAEVNSLLSGKAPSIHGNHVPALQGADNRTFLRNDNTWQVVTPANIGAAPSSHVTDKNNPHGVTKAHVGLGSVQNYPVATEAEALAGVANNRYLTPYLMARATKGTVRTRFVSGSALKTNGVYVVMANASSAKGGFAQIHYSLPESTTLLKITCDGAVIFEGYPTQTRVSNYPTYNDIWVYYTSTLKIEGASGASNRIDVEVYINEYL